MKRDLRQAALLLLALHRSLPKRSRMPASAAASSPGPNADPMTKVLQGREQTQLLCGLRRQLNGLRNQPPLFLPVSTQSRPRLPVSQAFVSALRSVVRLGRLVLRSSTTSFPMTRDGSSWLRLVRCWLELLRSKLRRINRLWPWRKKHMQRQITLVLGQTGSGKTHMARQLIKLLPRVLIIDAGFNEFDATAFDNIEDLFNYCRDGGYFKSGRPFRISYTPYPCDYEALFLLACELGDTTLVLEEADRFSFEEIDSYQTAIIRGRHYGLSLICLALHPYLLPKELRRQCTNLYSFRQTEPSDIAYITEIVGLAAERLPELSGPPKAPPHPYLIWSSNNGTAKIIGNDVLEKKPKQEKTDSIPADAGNNSQAD